MKSCKCSPLFTIPFVIFLGILLLIIGTLGFYLYEKTDFVTSFYNTSTIMAVVGATTGPHTTKGKIFSAFYTLFVGFFYITLISFIVGRSLDCDCEN
jgi:hypothetical protein